MVEILQQAMEPSTVNNNYKLINIYQGDERILQFWMDEINQYFIGESEEER